MAWTQPRTWVTGEVPTATIMNAHLRDNMRALVWTWEHVDTSETRTATAYGDLTTVGPDVTVSTDTQAVVVIGGQGANDTVGQHAIISFAISGATTRAAMDNEMYDIEMTAAGQLRAGVRINNMTGLTAGSNTFTAKYRVTGGTGTFTRRRIAVLGVGPA